MQSQIQIRHDFFSRFPWIHGLLLFFIIFLQPFKELHVLYDSLLFLALAFTVIMMLQKKFIWPSGSFLFIWGAYTLSIILSSIFSIDPGESLDGIRSEYLKQMIVFAVILGAISSWQAKRKAVIYAFLFSGIVMSTIGFFPYFFGLLSTRDSLNRLLSFSGSYTRLAYFYVLYVPVLILLLPRASGKKSIALHILIFLSLAATFFSKTRGGWICVPFTLVLASILARKWKILCIIIALLVLVTSVLFISSPSLRARAWSFREMKDWSGSFGHRKRLWQSAWGSIKDHPVIGAGYGKYIFRQIGKLYPVPAMEEARSDTHNTFIEILVQRGVLGLLTTFLLYLYFLKQAWRGAKKGSPWGKSYFAFFVAVSAGFCIFSLVDNIYVKETGRYLWQIAALGWSDVSSDIPVEGKTL
jgi:O-antigen ligase